MYRSRTRRKPARRLLANWLTIDARPGSVEVFGGALSHRLHECVSFGRCADVEGIRSSVCRCWQVIGAAFERRAIGPKEHADLDAAVSAVRTIAAGPLHLLSVRGQQQEKTVWECLEPPWRDWSLARDVLSAGCPVDDQRHDSGCSRHACVDQVPS